MKAPAVLLCLAFASTVHAVDADRFMPYGESLFGPYRDDLCTYIDRLWSRR